MSARFRGVREAAPASAALTTLALSVPCVSFPRIKCELGIQCQRLMGAPISTSCSHKHFQGTTQRGLGCYGDKDPRGEVRWSALPTSL
jgi:hypothetical protein